MILLLALLLAGQAKSGQGTKPPATAPKTIDVEIKDPLRQAAVLFEAAQIAHQKGELPKAIEYYREALKRDPSLWPAEFQLSVAHLSLGQLSEARSAIDRTIKLLFEFREAPELRGFTARAHIVRGEIALAESKLEEGEASFRSALELNPEAGQAHAGLAEVLLAREKFDEAFEAAKAAIAAGDHRSSTWTLLGAAQFHTGLKNEALASYDEALKRNPAQIAALRGRADINIARQQWPAAIADLRAAMALDDNPHARLHLAEVLCQAKQYKEAIEIFRQLIASNPDNADARTGLTVALIDSGQAKDAIAELEGLVKARPERADLHAQLAELSLSGEPERALGEYQAAAKLEPTQPRHQIGVASALVRLRRYQEAVPLLRQVLSTGLKEDIAYFAHTNLATALFELDDFGAAAVEYLWILRKQQARGDQKRAAITLYFIGVCFDKLRDFEQALKAYEQFLSIATSDNQLEIEKIKLRLPSLRRQIEQSPKRKRS